MRINPRKCTVCGLCAQICSTHHLGMVNPNLWNIAVQETPEGRKIPKNCIFCGHCITACPTQAIRFENKNKVWMIAIDSHKCNLCGPNTPKCVQICPSEVIKYTTDKEIPFMCDFCGGHPECVENCPSSAISVRPLDAPTVKYIVNLSDK